MQNFEGRVIKWKNGRETDLEATGRTTKKANEKKCGGEMSRRISVKFTI